MRKVQFTAQASATECEGCVFARQESTVCRAASAAAVAEGMPDCEDRPPGGGSYIYLKVERDERQLLITEEKGFATIYANMACHDAHC